MNLFFFQPHLHALITEGAFFPDASFPGVPGIPPRVFTRVFVHGVVAMSKEEGNRNARIIRRMQGWKHSDFSVDTSLSSPVSAPITPFSALTGASPRGISCQLGTSPQEVRALLGDPAEKPLGACSRGKFGRGRLYNFLFFKWPHGRRVKASNLPIILGNEITNRIEHIYKREIRCFRFIPLEKASEGVTWAVVSGRAKIKAVQMLRHLRRLSIPIALFSFFYLFSPQKAYAYLDPGTGSFFFQMIIAALLGGLFAVKLFWNGIRLFFKKLFSRMVQHDKSED